MPTEPFKADMEKIQKRARDKMMDGAYTGANQSDREQVVEVLNQALATEIVCILRYRNHYYTATGINAEQAAAEFLEHANEEQMHADWLSTRIDQLGGVPNWNPEGLTSRAHASYSTSDSLVEMIKEDLVAERVAVEIYSEIIRWLGDDDPTTRRMMEDILKMEEDHADDLAGLLENMEAHG